MKTKLTINMNRYKQGVLKVLLTLCALVAVSSEVKAETVTIGDGTSSYPTYSPFGNYYQYSTTAAIYTAAEVGTSGSISKISYYCDDAYNLDLTELKVYMTTTSSTTFSSTSDWPSSYTEVYSGSNVTIGYPTGWFDITLDTEYDYDADAGNLMVIITKKANYYSSAAYYYTTTSGNTYLYRQSDDYENYGDITTSTEGTLSTYRPNIQLTITPAPVTPGESGGGGSSSASAGYVIYSGSNYLNSSTDGTTTFNPGTCLWTGSSGGTWQNAAGYYLRRNNNNNSTFYVTQDNYSNCTLYGTEDGTTGQRIRIGTNNNGYLLFNNSWTTYSSGYASSCVFAVTKTTYNASWTTPAIGGPDEISNIGTSAATYTRSVDAAYTQKYYDYVFYDGAHHYCTSETSDATTTAPSASTFTYTWELEGIDASYAEINSSTGVINYKTVVPNDVVATVKLTATSSEKSFTVTKNVTFLSVTYDPTSITASDKTLGVGTDEDITYTLTASDTPIYDSVVGSSSNESVFTVSSNPASGGSITLHPVAAGTATLTLSAKKRDDGTEACSTTVTITVKDKVATPVITIDSSTGGTTITCATDGATIYYTTDGTDPTTSSQTTPLSFTASSGTTIKAFAVKDGYLSSDIASQTYTAVQPTGVSGGVVTLNDYEDHEWTYYSGVDASVDGGNYNTDYDGTLYSPNPRNVKITYDGNGGAVSIDESETTFVYYKTLEEGTTSGQYPYTVISNPFSKRPTGKGFGGWKIVSGGDYINGHSNNDVLDLDEEITFVNLPYPSVNCTSAEIELQATWVNYNNRTYANGNSVTYNVSGGTYETNFLVLNGNVTGTITVSSPCTIMMVEPDGSKDYRDDYTFTGSITPLASGTTSTKIEFAHWNPGAAVNPRGRSLTIGRGMTMDGTRRALYGTNNEAAMNQILKVESGNFSTFTSYNAAPSSVTKHWVVLGCDYDRAKGNNGNLQFTGRFLTAASKSLGLASTDEMARVWSKSGSFMTNVDIDNADAENSYYIGITGNHNNGHRYLEIQGGEWYANIAGGMGQNHTATVPGFTFRMKGGIIRGSVYGAAAFAGAGGTRTYVITGGSIGGWVAGGANGTQSNGGLLSGATYIYVGGKARIDSNGSTDVINRAVGGNVFGAGCGYSTDSNSGQISLGTNVVIADEAYVERGVYGGGSYGFCATTQTSNIYITGGTVDGVDGGVNGANYRADITGGVYGGACQNKGGSVNIYMTDGQVNGGIYGGSNADGTLSGSVTMHIDGGQVGTSSATANIHGGGYGQATRVSGNVEITLGESGQTENGVVVYGDVYGGSALGYVNGTTANNNYHTYVTMNKGTINGSLYGGALGDASTAANVYGPVAVKVYGGTINTTSASGSGGVYGANNVNGAPQRAVTVDIYGTDPAPDENSYALDAVYGGGNAADYTYAAPVVKVHNCDNSIAYVYGGGNAAAVSATDVTIYGGNVIGNVFGGGNGTVTAANVTGNTNLKIYGGTILNVFGGSNSQGTIGGTINVTVDSQADTDVEGSSTACTMNIGSVYGGGNEADSNVGNISIGCTGDGGHIENVFGGANQANITGNIELSIDGGSIGNVFGGNNADGDIDGTITVKVGENPNGCSIFEIGNVYGGGNLADYATPTGSTNYPAVNIYSGTITNNVYGGGLGATAVVTGNPQVTIGDSNANHQVTIGGDVYGGGDAAEVTGTPVVHVINKCNTSIANVYGGGNAADVSATSVTIDGGTITGMVFGGGHGDKASLGDGHSDLVANVDGDVSVEVTGGTINKVFGGSNTNGNITGSITLNIEKGADACDMKITEVYGGGNLAAGNAGTITIGCTGTESEGIGDVYGGANQADINNDITLNITGGKINNVFGGNNTSGSVNGTIEVNVEWSGSCGVNSLGNVYGAGNKAAYGSTESNKGNYPVVNIKNGTVSGNVFGGGLGATAIVYGNPQVTIGDNTTGHEAYVAAVNGDVYGGGDAAAVVGTPVVNVVNKCNTTITNVYGGGNAADVNGTDVNIDGGTISGMVFGGGHGDKTTDPQKEANVNGNVNVDVTGGTINKVFGGSNSKGNIKGTIALNINKGTNSCDMHITEVYGGGNEAAGNAGTITIGCTGTATEGIGDVYGGANAANINSDITLNITGGKINRVFGGNNTSGAISGDIEVNVEWTGSCGVNSLGNVYGAGNQAAYAGSPVVNILNGTVTGSVYGGGLGATAIVTGTPQVNIDGSGTGHSVTVTQNVLGGGDAAAVTGSTDVNIINGAVGGSVFGGGNAAGVSADGMVDVTGGTIATGVYGGSNASGTVGNTIVTLTGGTVGTAAANANVHGGGYGASTLVSGNVTVNIGTISGTTTTGTTVIYGDVYGGSALGNVNTDTSNTTHVNLNSGTIHGDAYGGGLGDASNAALVNGNVTVTQNGVAFVSATTTVDGSDIVTAGRIFGCNNVNGTPKGSVLVLVKKTVAADGSAHTAGALDMKAVYGGGNLAAYQPDASVTAGQYSYSEGSVTLSATGQPLQVVIDGCSDVGIEYVYGGGNAAATPSTDVLILGANKIEYAFGGGNGKDKISTDGSTWTTNPGADVGTYGGSTYGTGIATMTVLGGTVTNVFGGSNAKGNIVTRMDVTAQSNTTCPLQVTNLFGGGNQADSGPGNITIGCMEDGNKIEAVYGGANKANITGDVTLNIVGGNIGKVFGGNNLEGTINGKLIVNINRTDESCGWNVDYVYGGGNMAAYTAPAATPDYPEVNIIKGNVNYAVFGGGYGSTAIVTGNPQVKITGDVTIGKVDGSTTYGSVYGGGDAAKVVGSPLVTVSNGNILSKVFGGGNAADIDGTTNVSVTAGTIGEGVYGGCNTQGTVSTDAVVSITGGTIGTSAKTANIHGGGYGNATRVSQDVSVTIGTACDNYTSPTIYGDVYGGSAQGLVNGTTANTNDSTIVAIKGGTINGSVYGGGLGNATYAANVYGPVAVNITGGRMTNVFGCNNVNGAPQSGATVTVNDACNAAACGGEASTFTVTDAVYGGGNMAASPSTAIVLFKDGAATKVFGGGLGEGATVTGAQVTVSGGTIGTLYGGGNLAEVNGTTLVNLNAGDICNNVYGGGNGSITSTTAGQVTQGVTVNIAGGTVGKNVYGGGAIANTNTASGATVVNLTGGLIKGDAFGGGEGVLWEPTDENKSTYMTDTSKPAYNQQYWNAAAKAEYEKRAAIVNGNVTLTLNGTAFEVTTVPDDDGNAVPASGRIFGCNNLNGTPKGTVLVHVLKTVGYGSHDMSAAKADATVAKNESKFELAAVYGGGNLAGYQPTDAEATGQFTSYTTTNGTTTTHSHDATKKPVQVVIDGCDLSSIEYIYGGGSSADVPATDVTIIGCYEIGSVFGGGNGKDKNYINDEWRDSYGADVGAYWYTDYGTGEANTNVFGGTVHHVFGGSNTLGNVRKTAVAFLDEASDCPLVLGEIYGGGNEAYMEGDSRIELGCITYLQEIYGGAKKADVGGDIELTITSGHFDRVFGGNNLGGTITGSITVNIEETGCNPITIGELYGCGNAAAYTTPSGKSEPTVNIKSFTSIGRVFGGGLGATAVVTGNPVVNINEIVGVNATMTPATVYAGTTRTLPDNSTVTLPTHESGKIGAIGTVFGGGNAAAVVGNTNVNVGTLSTISYVSGSDHAAKTVVGVDIRGNVYGGGNAADVTGNTNVVIGQ